MLILCKLITQITDTQTENLVVRVTLSTNLTIDNYTLCYDAHWKSDWSDQICEDLGFHFAASTRVVPTNQPSQVSRFGQVISKFTSIASIFINSHSA